VDAIPGPCDGFRYGPRTALLVIDVQNDFADPSGSLSVPGGDDVVVIANTEIANAWNAGAVVMYSQDWHPPETPHFAAQGGPWPVHCVRGSWGAQLHPDLVVHGEVVRKGTGGEDGYSAFTMRHPTTGAARPTHLEAVLKARGINAVMIVGLATDYCVVETGLDAIGAGLGVTVHTAGVRAVDVHPGDGGSALQRLATAGANIL